MQYRATQKQIAREYLAKFILTDDFLEFTGSYSVIVYLLQAWIEFDMKGSAQVFDPVAPHGRSRVRVTSHEQLRKMLNRIASEQERKYLDILRSGRFALWPAKFLPYLIEARKAVEEILRTEDLSMQHIGQIVNTLIELEDELKRTFGLMMFE